MTWAGMYRGRPVSGAVIIERPYYRRGGQFYPLPRPPHVGTSVTVVGNMDDEGNYLVVFDDGRVEDLHWTTTLPADTPPALFRVGLMQRLIEYFDDFYDAVDTYAYLLAEARPGTKTCARCGYEKSVRDFGSDATRRDGLEPRCRECRTVPRQE